MANTSKHWTLVCHCDHGGTGTATLITPDGAGFASMTLDTAGPSGGHGMRQPRFLGVGEKNLAVVLEPETRELMTRPELFDDAFPAYAYRDRENGLVWFMNDGDKKTGNDDLNCGDRGSTVAVIRNEGAGGKLIKIICVGRGHHVTTFTAPTPDRPDMPRRAFVSNLIDGSITVLGNDPNDTESYLNVIDTINLCEADKEESGEASIPNNAFPHGKEFSPATGKIYSLSNGYGTVAVIDPVTNTIEDRIELKKSSNLLLSPDGRYLVGKGADRKSDPEHVLGRLSVIDLAQRKVVASLDIPDVYPSVYRFSPDGSRLYVTTAATGKGTQRDNLDLTSLLVYDAGALPELKLLKTVSLGKADCGRRPIAFYAPAGKPVYTFVPNPTDGTMSILNGDSDDVVDTVRISDGPIDEVNFSFWRGDIYGA